MTDRELLELAAKAAGIMLGRWDEEMQTFDCDSPELGIPVWNALTSGRDALHLAVRLGLIVDPDGVIYPVSTVNSHVGSVVAESHNGDPYAATRRAIVRAAAEIGKQKL